MPVPFSLCPVHVHEVIAEGHKMGAIMPSKQPLLGESHPLELEGPLNVDLVDMP